MNRKGFIKGLAALFGASIVTPSVIANDHDSIKHDFDDEDAGWDDKDRTTMSIKLSIPDGFKVMSHWKDEASGRIANTSCLPLGSESRLEQTLRNMHYTHVYEVRLYRTKLSEWMKSPRHPMQYVMARGLRTPPMPSMKQLRGLSVPFDHLNQVIFVHKP